MSILPEGEDVRKAVKWLSEMRQEHPQKKISALIAEACLKFDLSPGEAESLTRILSEKSD